MNISKPQINSRLDVAEFARQAAKTVSRQTAGKLDLRNAAAPAAIAATVSEVVEAKAKRAHVSFAPGDLATVRAQVADRFASSVGRLGADAGAARQAAGTLAAAAQITAREDEIFAEFAAHGPQKLGPFDEARIAKDLGTVLSEAIEIGATIAHDSWFAASANDTVQGSKNNDLEAMGVRVRARPFMAPSRIILESGDEALIKTMRDNNMGGVKNALAAIVDSGSTHEVGREGYLAATRAIRDPFRDGARSGRPSTESIKYLRNLGYELSEVRASFQRGETPKWKELPAAARALSAVHDRYLQATPWASDHQRAPFPELSAVEQSRDVPALMAAIHGALSAMKGAEALREPSSERPNVPSISNLYPAERIRSLGLNPADETAAIAAVRLREAMAAKRHEDEFFSKHGIDESSYWFAQGR
ncbi:MAG: hypothetical protein HYV07_07380 [Deltaproteobacteria bacterium]|nr:hypothetical protein [Deltaproteobacteria bacterium]